MLWILIGYMYLFIHRPFEIWPALGDMHVERIYALGAIFATAFYGGKKWLPNRQHLAFFGFATVVLVCWLGSRWATDTQPGAAFTYTVSPVAWSFATTAVPAMPMGGPHTPLGETPRNRDQSTDWLDSLIA